MKASIKKEVEKLIKVYELNCTIKKFKDCVGCDWPYISHYQNLSQSFIREFKDKVEWPYISSDQNLSQSFIREFQDKVDWSNISVSQKLSESFIREFKDRVDWICISSDQKLSESFIREFKDKVSWYWISEYQKLSESFIREFKGYVDIKVQKKVHKEKSLKQKRKELKEYAKKHNLKFDGKYLYAFREHDKFGRGMYSKTTSYKKGKYYKDWHCDMRKNEENSFGYGIWPKNNDVNTEVRVKIEDWEVAVNKRDGKARVYGFEIVKTLRRKY